MTPRTLSTAIHTRALLVCLTISTWTARKYDRKVTNETNARHNASADAGRYNKFLLPGDASSYQTLVKLSNSVRASHYDQTLAWSDEGRRLLPTANYVQYSTWFREQQRAHEQALEAFVTEYPSLCANVQRAYPTLYNADDYPSIGDIRRRFALRVDYDPLPATGDIRVNLADDQIEELEQSIAARQTSAVEGAMRDAWTRLHDVVARIHERLSDPDAIFRDSLIGNARELCDVLTRLNVTNDPHLEAMRVRVATQLTSLSPDVLRDEPRLRASTAQRADTILRAMSGVLRSA